MSTSKPRQGPRLALHWKILIGLVLGLIAGLVANQFGGSLPTTGPVSAVAGFLATLNEFVGDLFIRLLRFIAVPIVLFSLVVGTASLNDIKKLSRIGGKTIVIYIATTAVAITVGLTLANAIKPGTFVSQEVRDQLAGERASDATQRIDAAVAPDVWTVILDIVPTNPFNALASGNMLQIVFLALALGIALSLLKESLAAPVIRVFQALNDAIIKIVLVIMEIAPYAVFCLIAGVVASMGLEVLRALAIYSLVVIAGLLSMILIVYPTILRLVAGVGYRRFFSAIAPAQLLAFSSSSSSATLPVTIECVENRLGVKEEVASFVLPLGATINMDGTALYQGVAAVFIAQLFGINLDLSAQLTIVLTATLASIGTAGVPGVGMIMLVIVLQSVNMPPEVMTAGVAVIFGVDRLLDMSRTVCNVTGDAMVATTIAKTEGALLSEAEAAERRARDKQGPIDESP